MALEIDREKCMACGGCVSLCPADALELKNKELTIDHEKCVECGNCVKFCPVKALEIKKDQQKGEQND